MKKLLALAALSVLAAIAYVVWVAISLPDISSLIRTNPKSTALMKQRAAKNKTRLQPLNGWTSYNRISVYLRNAVLVSEDSSFFQHQGFDWTQIKESIRRDWKDKRFSKGASTITQQLAKNLYLSTSRNPLRKIQ